MFCSECGTYNDDSATNCSKCGCAFEVNTAPAAEPTHQQPSAAPQSSAVQNEYSNAPFFATLLGSSEYSVVRAKWFYTKAEGIINVISWLLLAFMAIMLAFTFFASAGLGMLQLLTDVGILIFFFIWLVFAKLILVGIGSVIRMTEIMESDRKK